MLLEYVALAAATIRAQRLRAALTVLAIAIGVGAVILLTSLAQSGLATLVRGLEEMGGARVVLLWRDAPKEAANKEGNYLRGLTRADVQAIRERVPAIERLTAFSRGSNARWHRRGTADKATDVVHGDETFAPTWPLEIAAGRNLTAGDLARRERVAVIGDDLAQAAFPGEEAVGQELVINDQRYRVVGRVAHAAKGGMNFGFDWNHFALLPGTLARPGGDVDMAALVTTDKAANGRVIDLATALLRHRHNGLDDFQFLDFGNMLAGFFMVFTGVLVLVGVISGMSLVIGGVGIMNIMLVALTERKKEIGLRRAVGADRGAVMTQFLVEAVVLSLFGAVIGLVVGGGLAQALAWGVPLVYRDWVGVVSLPAVVLAVLSAASIGVFFGWYPARQAAQLDPIMSLRAE